MALAAVLTLGACRATGGGYIDAPLPGPVVDEFTGEANFGFNFTCEMATTKKKQKQAVIKGQITYHDDPSTINVPVDPDNPGGATVETPFPEIRLRGTIQPILILANSCQDAIEGLRTAIFEGKYRSQDTALSAVQGEFRAQVFDQGEPSGSVGEFTGDEFSIQLLMGPYNGYTRGGYIEGGNIQVED
jgi:hypothetical protein